MSGQLEISVAGEGCELRPADAEQLILEIKGEIEASGFRGVRIEEKKVSREGTLGPEWLPILTAFLASTVVAEAIKGIASIICSVTNKKPNAKVILKGPNGEVEISASSKDDLSDLLKRISTLLDG